MNAADDDFGPFVSGPLDFQPSRSPTPPHAQQFLQEAKSNTDRNRKAVLDELLAHQDDPLYWHKPSHSPPAPPIATTPTIHTYQSSPSSWLSTIHDKIPSTHNTLPFTKSFFPSHHTNTAPATAFVNNTSTLRRKASSPSPFAPHVFVPIPGAPGFMPEEYDWDKGFSAALEHEAIAENNTTSSRIVSGKTDVEKEHPVLVEEPTPMDVPKIPSPAPVNLGEYIEKKSGSIELVGRRISTAPVLTPAVAEKIRAHLPALSRLPRTWSLIYSLDQHGISLKTLYANCEATSAAAAKSRSATRINGMLFVVKDADGIIFGAWMGDGLRMSRGNEKYYGSGESFLWKWVEADEELRVYKWTGKNDYVALCEPDFISFGGGDGSYGLYLDDTLFEGTSARSITFANEVLCSASGPRMAGGAIGFECVGVEVWSIGS
ncbi:Oxidation resistance protein 1 [Leucoagaricus sp. SymC.cos]|nr:Oxidation resistance protein 1 [Leucoagaricus sp. SymC.cos]